MQPAHWQVASWCGFVGTISLASGIGPCGPGVGLIAESGGFFFGFIRILSWYPWTIPRCRPIAYQAIALPLSYKGILVLRGGIEPLLTRVKGECPNR